MRILIIGSDGMLGTDLTNYMNVVGYELFTPSIKDFNLLDADSVAYCLLTIQPDVVINCAAYTKVDIQNEVDEQANYYLNYKSLESLVENVNTIGAYLIHISTDYVFDLPIGDQALPNTPTNPINRYGKMKAKGEEVIQTAKTWNIIRTSWLFGHHGKNFVETMLSLARQRKEIKVVNDQYGSPTWTIFLAKKIEQIIRCGIPDHIYHICGKGSTTWYKFAKRIYEKEGVGDLIKPCISEEYKTIEPRPHNSTLKPSDLVDETWERQLEGYLNTRREGIERYRFSRR